MARREHLSAVDAAWYRMDERGDPADIGAVMLFDGPLDEARVRSLLAERLAPHPRFRQRVVDSKHRWTSPRWEDEVDFSIDAHVDTWDVEPPPGVSPDAALAARLSAWMSEPVDFRRSPWRARLLRMPGGGWALFCRLHHCMGDGFALLGVLLGLADRGPGGGGAPAPSSRQLPPREDGALRRARRLARDAAADAAALARLLLVPFERESALRGKPSGRRSVAWSDPIPLEDVKRVARASSATVNDVLVAALSGALRRWLEERGGPSALRAIVPVNLRPPGTPIDERRGNWFGLVFLDLPTDVPDRAGRTMAVAREMSRLKRSREAVVTLGILATIGRAPAVVDHVVDDLFARKASVVVTNVPGPREPLAFGGAALRDLWFWVPHPCGLALGASIMSYAGRVRVGIRADSAVEPEPERIARWFALELAAASAAVADASPPPARDPGRDRTR